MEGCVRLSRQLCWRRLVAPGLVLLVTVGTWQATAQDAPKEAAKASPLDEPLAHMYEARKAYADVRDYTCTLIKRENVPANHDDNIIQMKFRQAPFSVYMRWLAPNKFKGQEVAYFHGKNRNKLRVHAKGLFKGLAGFVSIDVNDPRVMEFSRHNIYEAGIGHLIEHTIQHWEIERKIGKTEVRIGEYDYNKRRCIRFEASHPERRPEFYCYRTVIYIDKESRLPVRAENYDWPRAGGPEGGDAIETVSYIDLRVNVGLSDRDFDR